MAAARAPRLVVKSAALAAGAAIELHYFHFAWICFRFVVMGART